MKNFRLYSEWPTTHKDFMLTEWRFHESRGDKEYLDFVIEKSSGKIVKNGEEKTKKMFFVKAYRPEKWKEFKANCFLLAGWEYTKPTIIFDYWKLNEL